MKKILMSLVAVSIMSTGAMAASSCLTSQVEVKSEVAQAEDVKVQTVDVVTEDGADEGEFYYDHVEIEAPIVDIQVEAEIETP